jgi:acetoin utilization deacetylase AcuC-like enzyme
LPLILLLILMERKTGYCYEELYNWHSSGSVSRNKYTQDGEIWENPDTKRRLHSLIAVSGLLDKLTPIKARHALKEDLMRFHDESYIDNLKRMSDANGGDNPADEARFGKGGYEIATLSAGGVLAAVDGVVSGAVDNAYCLVRPPGHHATRNKSMGFCLFNNVALAAMYARERYGLQKIAIVDYDVHHVS